METKIGRIKSLDIKHGQNAAGKPWVRYAYEMDDGHKFSHFDKTLGDKFKIGDSVEVTGEVEGQYWTMSEIKAAKADSMVHIDETPQAEKVVETKLRCSRTFQEIGAGEIIKEAVKLYVADENVDGVLFPEMVNMVREEFVKVRDAL